MHKLLSLQLYIYIYIRHACERFWWFWTFSVACIHFSVVQCLCGEFWTFCGACFTFLSFKVPAENCERFEHFIEHAFTFLSFNVPAESCERFWWFWTFYGACIHFSVMKRFCCRIQFFCPLKLTSVICKYFIQQLASSTAECMTNQWTAQLPSLSAFQYIQSCILVHVSMSMALRMWSQTMHCISIRTSYTPKWKFILVYGVVIMWLVYGVVIMRWKYSIHKCTAPLSTNTKTYTKGFVRDS